MHLSIDNGGKYEKVLTNWKRCAIIISESKRKKVKNMNKPFAETGKQKKEKIAIALDKRDSDLISRIAESECRSRSNVIQMMVKEYLKNHNYYSTSPDATQQPTTGENIKAVSEPIEPTETDAQQPELLK